MELEVLEEGVHSGLSVCGDEEVVHVNTDDLDAVLGVPSEQAGVHWAGFETRGLQFAGFVREARLAEAVKGIEKAQVAAGAVVVSWRLPGKDRVVEFGLDVGVVGVSLFAHHTESVHDCQYGA